MQEPPAGPGGGMGGGLTFGLPRPGRAVKIMLGINVAVFVVQLFLDRPTAAYPSGPISRWFGVTVGEPWQIWRFFTAQFLHANFWHILFNMLGLYILGSSLERHYGAKRFVAFYLTCGVAAGLSYVIIGAAMGSAEWIPLIGASGGVYGIVLACAVYFPHFMIIFLFFPVPIRLAAIIIFGGMIITVLSGLTGGGATSEFWSQAAHFGGAICAAVWIWGVPRFRRAGLDARAKLNQGAWERKMRRRAEDEGEVDRILQKIQDEGLGSLTDREKRTLQDATRRQRDQERDLHRL